MCQFVLAASGMLSMQSKTKVFHSEVYVCVGYRRNPGGNQSHCIMQVSITISGTMNMQPFTFIANEMDVRCGAITKIYGGLN
jgi:hypothetical protein